MSKREPTFDIVGKRPDSMGLFWSEPRKIKPPPLEKVKRIPPEPVWLADDYMPNLDDALAWEPDLYQGNEVWMAAARGEYHVFDIEHFHDYFLIMFKSLTTGKITYFEKRAGQDIALQALHAVSTQLGLVGFNSRNYDIPMLTLALAGCSFEQLRFAQMMIIEQNMRGYEVLREFKVKQIDFNHIDLIEVAPLAGSLKIYGGRLHSKRMQDLPFPPHSELTREKEAIVRWYCANDLDMTADLYRSLQKDIKLRESLGAQYKMDLRSKSDAQIAESVIVSELTRLTGVKPQRSKILAGTCYFYQPPAYLQYRSETLQWVLSQICNTPFIVEEGGTIPLPDILRDTKFRVNETEYQIGIGGLHSCEAHTAQIADAEYCLIERDVASYYPFIILNLKLYPEHLGAAFLTVYKTIVDRRLKAKREGDKHTADSLKITINGTFGKLGNKWSVMYSPRLMLQVTITGQLSLLYLIEKIELAGMRVVSANTDGLVIRCPRVRRDELNAIIGEWERETDFTTEESEYHALLSRSVNDYIAVKTDLKVKGKGQLGRGITELFKNPVNLICVTAIERFLSAGVPIQRTVCECRDLTQFLTVRAVQGGAVKQGVFLGKAIRWYYATDCEGEIVYAKTGNKVPRSEGAQPCMKLPDTFPSNVDFAWYVREAEKMLGETGYS